MKSKPHITIYSSRFGGPYSQYRILQREFTRKGYAVTMHHRPLPMLRSLLFDKKDVVISLVPLPFRFGANRYILNIKGEYPAERHLLRNPLAYLYPRATRIADAVVVPSQFLKKTLHLRDAIVIPNCIGSQPAPRRHQHDKGLRLITATNFSFRTKARGLLTLLRALAATKTTKPIIYDIYGDGTFLDETTTAAKRITFPANIHVTFRGHTDSLHRELATSDIFLYWSEHDNMPNAVLEAMAAGLPIITNNVGAIPEMIRHGKDGLIVTKQTLPQALNDVLSKPALRQRLGTAARARAAATFSTASIADRWLALAQPTLRTARR